MMNLIELMKNAITDNFKPHPVDDDDQEGIDDYELDDDELNDDELEDEFFE